jgi:hypothetical protein
LDSIEKAIRDALAKGDANNRAYREKVYRSVLAALERANTADTQLSPEAIAHRRNVLKSHITAIETEYVPAVAPAVDSPAAAPGGAAPAPEVTPLRNEPAPAYRAGNEDSMGARAEDRLSPPDTNENRRRKRPYAAMFVAVTFVAALAIGAWWASETGLFGRPDNSVPNPPTVLESEEFDPDTPPPLGPGDTGQPRDWVTLFSPDDPSSVTAPSGAVAQVKEDDDGTFLELRSGAGGEAVLFDIPAAVLQELAGGAAVFDIVARAEEGQETQFSVTCNFGEMGDCGRRRYIAGYERADYLFDVELPRGSPGAAGTIAIVPDVSGGGKVLHVFEVRVAR